MPAPINAALLRHPALPCTVVSHIDVAIATTADEALALRYRVHGAAGGICLPATQPAAPADGLWQHTCCEAFMATVDGPEYHEFNFAPSGQWAVYRFTGYRERDPGFSAAAAPRITVCAMADGFQLDVLLTPALLPVGRTLLLGLSAVIEATDGSKSYWALQHGAAQPDFHLRQGFALALHRNTP